MENFPQVAVRCGFHRFRPLMASALMTFDLEIPNCRAILAGRMPAMKAARTAFTFPLGSGIPATSRCRGLEPLSRLVGLLRGKAPEPLGGVLPRRFILPRVAACSDSKSSSFRCLTALGRFFVKTWRCCGWAGAAFTAGSLGGELSRTTSAEKRSGKDWPRSRPMVRLWRSECGAATPARGRKCRSRVILLGEA